ncbi:hypothetical protein CLV44_1382 [Marinobacterium halophilum]|uniref:ATPase AAA-type core domain-containing protein n=1 Tax=Marinobacterium halophilum TaxID=267374 RepID=A0A2P8EHI0_9GAMM|nr:ATP-binding protein [Marinobacterium halophilum]PSL08901.1 hypothetical protein CLV44_1382 [Marinobacterium halophilum]
MIIDFTVSNFRSIKDEYTFSLYAESKSQHLQENIAWPNDGKIGVLRTAGIYGANASGKSNLLRAFLALRFIICSSGDLKDGDSIPCYEPYLLSEKFKDSPTSFEIEFFSRENLRFIYKVSFIEKRILSESLDYYPSRQKANIFNRNDNDTWESISFGGLYKGGRKKIAFFENNSYLSKAGNSADAPEIVRSIFNFFRNEMLYIGANHQVNMLEWKEDLEKIKKVASILSKVDTGIDGFIFKDDDENRLSLPSDMPKELKKRILDAERKKPVFFHKGENGIKNSFSEDMESSGTLKLFAMLPLLLETLEYGGILLLDELDNSFHPHIAELIIKLFNDPKVNTKNAQLIFSTHNISLMSPSVLRRDQIWLTEKRNGSTLIASLEDFDKNMVKMDSPFDKWYSDGRFGGIPSVDYTSICKTIKS